MQIRKPSTCSIAGIASHFVLLVHFQLWFLFIPRINLSPFTKDFRGEEQ